MANDTESEVDSRLQEASEEVCSACGSEDMEDGPSEIGKVCVTCGAVASSAVPVDSLVESERGESKQRDWSDHYKVSNSTEQQVASAFAFLEVLGKSLDAPREVRERAAELYGDAAIEMATDGRSTEAVVAGAFVIAGRELQRPHPLGRVAEVSGIEVGQLRRTLSALRSDLDHYFVPCPPRAYLTELTRYLDLGESTAVTSGRILEELPPERIGGKHPAAVAGAAIYLAADGDVTQRDIARVTGVTTETVRLRVKECRAVWSPRFDARADDWRGRDE